MGDLARSINYDPDKKAYIEDSAARCKVEIGDSKDSTVLQPQLKITSWDNECNFSMRLVVDETAKASAETAKSASDVVSWVTDAVEAKFYSVDVDEDGGFEFEIRLKEIPKSNVLTFTMNAPKDCEFYYQSELTEEDIKMGRYRPENVIGSYAVYHASKLNNKYKTGKICHIYRPWAEDADGNRVWCDLKIEVEKQEAYITIPQKWLGSAILPILIDPTFGYTSVGGSTDTSANDVYVGNYATSPTDFGLLTSISFHAKAQSGTGYGGAAIYTAAGTRLAADAGNVAINTTAEWKSVNVSYSGNPSTDYALVWWGSVSHTTNYDSVSGKDILYEGGLTFENWPNPASFNSVSDLQYSIYATYTASATEDGVTVINRAFKGHKNFVH